jgi:galactose mutarotase-like enzyme
MKSDIHTLSSGGMSAMVAAHGAELQSLRSADGHELLWQAGPQWPRHAPLLFPIVGRLKSDELRHQGTTYPMTQHGFARDQRFDWAERGTSHCTLVLTDNAETRSRYPFAFRLTVRFSLMSSGLEVSLEVTNTGDDMLPASIGAHPAFNWPLTGSIEKEMYRLTFADDEPAPIRRLRDGLLRIAPEPSPIEGRTLALAERLFADDAITWTSRAARPSAMRPITVRRSKCPGKGFASSACGRSLVARRFCASSPGTVLPARWILTASSLPSPA